MHYVYILRSINHPNQIYMGFTHNLTDRVKIHNAGLSLHTSKYLQQIYINQTLLFV